MEDIMRIEYFHASVYGNGAMVAEEFKKQMEAKGVKVDVHHIDGMKPDAIPPADIYVFSSPGRFGKPIKEIRRFLEKVNLPKGTKYALLTTEPAPKPDKKTGKMPTEEEVSRYQHLLSIMNEILQGKGLVKITETKVYVTALKGPLEANWQEKVKAFVEAVLA
jgi:flavodoxin